MPIMLENAQEMLLNLAHPVGTVRIPLEECHDRILAEDIMADTDFPPFDRSPLDGYAVRSQDVSHATPENPVILTVIDNIPAGTVGQQNITSGMAARIMTGAPLPPGADGVIRLEDTQSAAQSVAIYAGADAAKNICRQGEEIQQGEIVLHTGLRLNAGSLGMLAMLGHPSPLVFQRPRIGVLATGSEIIDIDQPLVPGKIRNSNSFMLAAQIREAGGETLLLGHIHDDTDSIVRCLNNAPPCDLYITTGGASVGDYDLMGQVFKQLSIVPLFDRVAIKPGMPVIAGMWGHSLLVGLSGNPAAASVSFELLIRPLLRKLSGLPTFWRPKFSAVLRAHFPKGSVTRRFVWAECLFNGIAIEVTPIGYQGNGMLKAMGSANALIDIPANSPLLYPGSVVEILLLHTGQ